MSFRHLRCQKRFDNNILRKRFHRSNPGKFPFHCSTQRNAVIQIIKALFTAIKHLIYFYQHCGRIVIKGLYRELFYHSFPIVILYRTGYCIPFGHTDTGVPCCHPHLFLHYIFMKTNELIFIRHSFIQSGIVQFIRNTRHFIDNQ